MKNSKAPRVLVGSVRNPLGKSETIIGIHIDELKPGATRFIGPDNPTKSMELVIAIGQ